MKGVFTFRVWEASYELFGWEASVAVSIVLQGHCVRIEREYQISGDEESWSTRSASTQVTVAGESVWLDRGPTKAPAVRPELKGLKATHVNQALAELSRCWREFAERERLIDECARMYVRRRQDEIQGKRARYLATMSGLRRQEELAVEVLAAERPNELLRRYSEALSRFEDPRLAVSLFGPPEDEE